MGARVGEALGVPRTRVRRFDRGCGGVGGVKCELLSRKIGDGDSSPD